MAGRESNAEKLKKDKKDNKEPKKGEIKLVHSDGKEVSKKETIIVLKKSIKEVFTSARIGANGNRESLVNLMKTEDAVYAMIDIISK